MTGRHRSTVAQTRSVLYATARTLGDVRAIQTHRVGRRIRNRIIGRAVTKIMRGWR
jgi:hypothetical protein